MQSLRISDAFDLPVIAPERLQDIIRQLQDFEPDIIRFRPVYGRYEVELIDSGRVHSPIILTETEISAVQAVYRGFESEKAPRLNAKLAEAERRIEEARDYAAELRGRPTGGMPGRKLVW